jgi:hypothetical protein
LVRIYQSSSAEKPALWLALTQPPPEETPGNLEASETHAHLTVDQAIEILIKLAGAVRYISPGAGEGVLVPPGEMHPVDKAFYNLTIKERNAAWVGLETLEKRISKALEFAEDGDLKAAIFQLKGEER